MADTSENTESQQKEDLLIRPMKGASPCFSSSLLSLEHSRKTSSLFRLKQYTNAVLHQTRCSFCFTAVKEKNSKNWLENTTLEHIWYSVHRNAQFQWQLQRKKKRFHQFSYIILSPGNKVRRHNNRNEWKSTVTTHQKVSTKLTA